MSMLLAALCASMGASTYVFLAPADLAAAEGVRLEARLPESRQVLVEAPGETPGLWMMPVAAIPADEGVRIYYQRVNKADEDYSDQRTLCLGYLRDHRWTVSQVGSGAAPWGGPDNVILRRSPHKPTWGGFNVHQIVRAPDGAYRMLYWDQPETGEAGAMLAYSPDGLTWTKDPRGAVFTEHNDAYCLLDRGEEGYWLYQTMLEPWPDKPYADNLDKFRRIQSLRRSKDLIEWTPQEPLLRPDEQDKPETEFYLLKVFPYGQGYAGLLMKYLADPAKPKQHSAIVPTELIVSADALTWERPYRDLNLGFWSYADPFIDGGRLCFAAHFERHLTLFTYRPHGLTAVTAEGAGRFTTRFAAPFGRGLRVNADARAGSIEIMPLHTETGEAMLPEPVCIEGLEGDALPVLWPDGISKPGSECRLDIRLEKAALFSLETIADGAA